MIICAAIKKNEMIYTGKRHHNIIQDFAEFKVGKGGVQGFIDDKNNFLDRKQAARHALECGQVETGKANARHVFDGKTLFSEDLY